MNKMILKVPRGVRMLSQWPDFAKHIPSGWTVMNKRLTGCGATTYFLEYDKNPLILCSHRQQLLECKAESHLHKGKVHLFKSSSDTGKEDLNNNLRRLHCYLNQLGGNPFSSFELPMSSHVPKILVTVDSLPHVIQVLKERGDMDKYCVVSDEMQCIFTDAAFKGDVVLGYMECLKDVKNVLFLSATPYLEEYLDQLEPFCHMNYIDLDWDSEEFGRTIQPTIYKIPSSSLKNEINNVIRKYKANGYFEQKTVNGQQTKAEQAVFFLNSVSDIIRTIKENDLTQDECNVICSKTNDKNIAKLDKIGFKIGSAQKHGENHKTYTFCTKCAYEGVDFYHPAAYTYVFANPNLANLSVDISIDLPQIMGRQRLDSNPFKNNATLFYMTTRNGVMETEEDFKQFINSKDEFTRREIDYISSLTGPLKSRKIQQVNSSHKVDGFSNDYISILTDSNNREAYAVYNNLVFANEVRAWDLRNVIYANVFLQTQQDQDFPIRELEEVFRRSKDFKYRMEKYCSFRERFSCANAQVEGSIFIPYEFHYYYNSLGVASIKKKAYQQSRIESELGVVTCQSEIERKIYENFKVGDIVSNKVAKKKLQGVYEELGIRKKAKATELNKYFQTERSRVGGENGIKIINVVK